jgi:hypothetical protein
MAGASPRFRAFLENTPAAVETELCYRCGYSIGEHEYHVTEDCCVRHHNCSLAGMSPFVALETLVGTIDRVGLEKTTAEWPDLRLAYNQAKVALKSVSGWGRR